MDLIPADSDYSLWSAQKHGHLPGLDVAFLLDASSYHTHQDTPDRIRPGTMQASAPCSRPGSLMKVLLHHACRISCALCQQP